MARPAKFLVELYSTTNLSGPVTASLPSVRCNKLTYLIKVASLVPFFATGSVAHLKARQEQRVLVLRNAERSLCEELYMTKTEIDQYSEQLEDIKDNISELNYMISNIEIDKMTERARVESLINDLNDHKKGFDAAFQKEQELLELRNKKLREKEEEQLGAEKQRQIQISERNEQQAREVAAVELECDAIERECAVLKKRNHAIMLKLRRKLVETEDARRALLQRNGE